MKMQFKQDDAVIDIDEIVYITGKLKKLGKQNDYIYTIFFKGLDGYSIIREWDSEEHKNLILAITSYKHFCERMSVPVNEMGKAKI